jgi:hypothetical protein
MKMRCAQCNYAGEKINFMKLDTADKTIAYVDACPDCGSAGPFEPFEEQAGAMHDAAQAVADRVFEEQRRAVQQYKISEDTLLSEEELKSLETKDD